MRGRAVHALPGVGGPSSAGTVTPFFPKISINNALFPAAAAAATAVAVVAAAVAGYRTRCTRIPTSAAYFYDFARISCLHRTVRYTRLTPHERLPNGSNVITFSPKIKVARVGTTRRNGAECMYIYRVTHTLEQISLCFRVVTMRQKIKVV